MSHGLCYNNFIMFGKKKSRRREDDKNSENLSPEEIYKLELGQGYEEYWDNLARSKDGAYFGVAGLPFGERATEDSLDAHGEPASRIIMDKLQIRPEHEVLEVGVGVGRLARHIAPHCMKFTGVDISSQMIAHGRERLKDIPNCTLLHHNRCDLSLFANESFDRVYFQVVLIHLDREDMFHYLRESYRVLRPGGKVYLHFYNLLHPKGFAEFRFATDFALEKGGKLRGRVQCCTAPEVRKYVEEAGFRICEDMSHLETVDQKYEFDVPDEDWYFYLIAVAEKPVKDPDQGG